MARKMGMKEACECGGGCSCTLGFGALVFLFGVVWLGNDLHWWTLNVPWIPVLAILFGVWLVTRRMCGCGGKCGCCH